MSKTIFIDPEYGKKDSGVINSSLHKPIYPIHIDTFSANENEVAK